MIQSKLPIRIFGEGWKQIPAFASLAAGLITSREELKHAVSSAAAVIHLWPANHAHPIDAAGPPVIRLASGGITAMIADARLALTSRLKPTLSQADSIDVAAITRTLRAVLGQ